MEGDWHTQQEREKKRVCVTELGVEEGCWYWWWWWWWWAGRVEERGAGWVGEEGVRIGAVRWFQPSWSGPV